MDRPKGWETLTQEIYTECRTVCLHLTTTTEFQRSYRRGQFYATQGRAENRGAKETKLVQPLLLSNLSPRVQREHLYILRYNQHFFNVNRSIPWNECSMNPNIHARIHANRLSTYVHSRTPIEIETDRKERNRERLARSIFMEEKRRKRQKEKQRERETYHRYDTVSRAERPRRKVVATGPPLGFRRFAGPTSSRLRNSLASLDSCVPASRPGDHRRRRSGIPRNHLNPARIRFRTCCPPRSPARPSPRRHLDGKRNKLSSVLPPFSALLF